MKKCFIWFLAVFLTANVLHARSKEKFSFTREGGYRISKVTDQVYWQKIFHQGFNMQIWLANTMSTGCLAALGACGGLGPDGQPFVGLQYPAGSGIEHLFGGGPWIAGKVNGSRHVSEGYNGDDARSEFIPDSQYNPRDRIWLTSVADSLYDANRAGYYKKAMNRLNIDDDGDGKIDEDDLDGLDNDGDWNPLTDDIGADGVPDSLEVGCNGGYDPLRNPDPAYDDYSTTRRDSCHPDVHGFYPSMRDKNRYTEKNGIPDHGEPHVDEDYGAVSDQDVYISATDTGSYTRVLHPDHFPMGIKVFMKSYAWANIDGILPIEYKIINVRKNIITDVFVGMFNDFDVGPSASSDYPTHDYAAYFDDLRTGYVDNPFDPGSTPAGLTVLHTPRALDQLQYVWQWHGFTDPGFNDSLIYGRMAWIGYDTTQRIKPNQSPTNLSDTRFYFSFGPFDTLRPPSRKPGGDTLDIVMCYVGGYSVDQGSGNLKEHAQNAIKLYAHGWKPPIVLPAPCTKIDTAFKRITLRWGGNVRSSSGDSCVNPTTVWDDSNKLAGSIPSRTIPPERGKTSGIGGRIFEGFKVYRSEDPEGQQNSFSLVGQWDIKDSLTSKYGVQGDYDTGLQPIYNASESEYYFIDTNLYRGKDYWYAVTAYGLPDMTIQIVKDNLNRVRYDTLYTASSESPISVGGENVKHVKLPFNVSNKLGEVLVVPNPYRVDRDYTAENGGYEGSASNWNERKRVIKFIHLPNDATIRVFTLAGDMVTTLTNSGSQTPGEVEWNLISQSNRALASGVYIFTVESQYGRQIGKFVLIR